MHAISLKRAMTAIALISLMGAGPCRAQEQPAPGEVKAIAEEAYLYGFPMIVGYDVLYKYFIDRDSGQFKAPINQIHNEARVFTPKDTGDQHAQQRHALFDGAARPARRADGAVHARDRESRYYDVQLVDLYTDNYGYMGSRTTGNGAGCYLVAGPDWKGRNAAGHQPSPSAAKRSSAW